MRTTAYKLAIESGATDFAAWLNRRRAVILTYHGLLSSPPPSALRPLYKIFVTAADFRAQMSVLKARYNLIPLRELVARLSRGETGERLAAVTFDDGWRTTRTLAAPILRELGIPATAFLATGLMDSTARGLWTQRLSASLAATERTRIRLWKLDLPHDTPARRASAIRAVADVLKKLPSREREEKLREVFAAYGTGPELSPELEFCSWDEVHELGSFGVECGAHTVDHEILSSLPFEAAADQIRRSRAHLEDVLGTPCRLFAYPNGSERDFSAAHARALESEGFDAAVTQIPGRNSPWTDRFQMRRINVGLEHTLESFITDLDGLRHW